MYGRKLNAYRQTGLQAEMTVADPYVITRMMYQGISDRLAQAKGALERGDLATKASRLSSAAALLENLRSTLDFSADKNLAQILYDIYSFMLEKIADAAIELTSGPIDAAIKVLAPIKAAWEKIPVSEREKAQAMRRNQNPQDQVHHRASLLSGTV
ncbi:MAG: flagellar export chaperone FliS [Succinivibrio sp.]|nr:flagellar export chaperone FliS [Succinivibrio sp.]